jgi:hypothetical protein
MLLGSGFQRRTFLYFRTHVVEGWPLLILQLLVSVLDTQFKIDSLCIPGADRTDNTASNSSSILACVRCLAMALVLLRGHTVVA